jgi:16S rRNA (uracil1498-N3)-methyltransferase
VRERRFLIDPGDIEAGRAVIRGDELHHLHRVLRLRAGDEVSVFDGRGRGFRGRIRSIESSQAVIDLGEVEGRDAEPRLRITLMQAIPHGERMDLIVEKATELGAIRIVPVVSERSVVRPKPGGWAKLPRLRRIAIAAAKQSGRLVVPEVAEPVAYEAAITRNVGTPVEPDAVRVIFHTSRGSTPGLRAIFDRGGVASVRILVGPEGGWTDDEFAAAEAAGWLAATLGSLILRADTAAVAALTLVLALAGEMER